MPEDPEGIEFSEAQGGGTHAGDHEHDASETIGDTETAEGPEEILESMSHQEEPMLPQPEAETESGEAAHGGNGGRHESRHMAASVEAGTVNVRGLVAVAHADEASVTGAAGAVMSTGETSFTGGAGLVSGGDMKVTGGAPLIIGRDEVDIEKGGALVVGANKVEVKDHGYVGLVMARRVKVKSGGRVIITMVPALVMGVLFGLTFALTRELLAGRGPELVGRGRDLFNRGEEFVEPIVERVRDFEMPEMPWRRRRGLLERMGIRR